MRVALIPAARSAWQAAGRVLGRVELPLADGAEAEVSGWLPQLSTLGMRQLLHGPDELSTRAARLLARGLRARSRSAVELAEVDMGLWAGLTDEQLSDRYATAYRELCEAPLNVSPPSGEALSDAVERLAGFVRKRLRRAAGAPFGLVLRPVARELLLRVLGGGEFATLWESVWSPAAPQIVDAQGAGALEGSSNG